MIEKEHFPRIRFKSFSEEWKLCKLKDISEQVIRKNINLESTLPLTISAQYGLVDQTTFFNNQVAGQNISNYYLIRKGEFAYNKSTSQDYPVGAVKRLERYEMGILSTLYILFRLQNTVSSDYLVAYFDSACWHKEITVRAAEGARSHGLLNISANDFFDIDIRISGDINEQEKIGIFLQRLDEFIMQKKTKYEKILNIKKTILRKMFPKEGENIPEIRYQKYNGFWKRSKVKHIFKVTRGYVLPATRVDDTKSTEMPYPVYSSQTKGNGLLGYYKDFLYENAITWTTDGANAGTVNYRAGKFYCTNVCGVLLSDQNRANYATAVSLNNVAWKHVSHVGNPKLMNNIMNEIEIYTPSIIEEEQILSGYLSKFDDLICLYQQQLIKLQNIKKAIIKKMLI